MKNNIMNKVIHDTFIYLFGAIIIILFTIAFVYLYTYYFIWED